MTYIFSETLGNVDFVYDGAWTQISAVPSSAGGVDYVNRWQEKVTLRLVKKWEDTDESERPESVTVHVTGGGINKTVTLSALLGWEAELTDLPRWAYDDFGNATEIVYTITEDAVSGYENAGVVRAPETGYSAVVGQKQRQAVYTLTNATEAVETTTVTGTKTWQKPDDVEAPEVTFTLQLLLKGIPVDTMTAVANEANGWTYTFENVPVEEPKTGTAYTWQITESVPTSVDGRFVQISAEKNLTGGVDFINRWYAWKDVTIRKVWDDGNDSAGIRPESVTVHVTGGSVDETVTLTEAEGWETTLTDLPVWQYSVLTGAAHRIVYTVTEETVPGYEAGTVISDSDETTFIITNTLSAATKTITGKKLWQKPDRVAEIDLPEVTVTLQVLLKGIPVDTMTAVANAANGWTYTFEDVPTRDGNGNAYSFQLSESVTAVDGHDFPLVAETANATGGVDFTNRWQETVNVSVHKTWDLPDGDSTRPQTVTVTLTGGERDLTAELSEANGWAYTFEDLPRWVYDDFGNAAEIDYQITEEELAGYQAPEVSRVPETGCTADGEVSIYLTNKALRAEVTVRKQWVGNDGEALTVRLKGTCGEATREETLTLNAVNGWKVTVEDLPRYGMVNGALTEWTWTVEEDALPGWTLADTQTTRKVALDGTAQYTFVLTNAATLTLSGQKYWQLPDESVLPDSVTITLEQLKNGIKVGEQTRTITANDGWKYEFAGLAVRDADGTAFTYNMTEPETITTDKGTFTQVSAETNANGGTDFTNRWQENVTLRLVKKWDDDSNSHEVRPESVTFHITGTADGMTLLEQDAVLTGTGDEWTAEVTGLPRWSYDDDGIATEIQYSVTEADILGYKLTDTACSPESGYTDGMATFTLTNQFVKSENIRFIIKKVWIGGVGADFVRVEVRQAGNWSGYYAENVYLT